MCLTPREAKLLVRFLDSVDGVVTARLLPDALVDERHLTSLLRETLDERFTGFHSMPYGLAALKADLEKDDSAMKVSLTIEANEYPPHIENRLTQADLGVILRYDNTYRRNESFAKAVLFQAKRIFPSVRHASQYSERDVFKSIEIDQLRRIIDLDGRYGRFIYYLFYGPRAEAYDEPSRKALRYLTLPTAHWRHHHPFHMIEEYGFLPWWSHVEEYASDPQRHFPGLLASRPGWLEQRYFERQQDGNATRLVPKPKTSAPTARDVYERMWEDTHALSWFLVYRLLMGHEGSSDDEAMRMARGEGLGPELGVAPRYTLELRISVGTAAQ
jgi:hypothetical protein